MPTRPKRKTKLTKNYPKQSKMRENYPKQDKTGQNNPNPKGDLQ